MGGEFIVGCFFRNVDDNFVWAFADVFMVLMSTMREGSYGMNWQDFLVGGIF